MNRENNCYHKQKELFYLENQLISSNFIAFETVEINWSLTFSVSINKIS